VRWSSFRCRTALVEVKAVRIEAAPEDIVQARTARGDARGSLVLVEIVLG
jgi:hypothetical protein